MPVQSCVMMRTSDAECRHSKLHTPMKKNLIMSRIAIVALGAGALCLATTSSALNPYPPLRTGANKDVSPAPAKDAAKAGSKLSAADKTYMDMMVKDHQADLAEFQEQAQSGTDPDLQTFAGKYSKVVQQHLDLAKQTQSKLK